MGFNLITSLPSDAFRSMEMLTLLALDGNPLPTLRRDTFAHLNGSLRGLSLGGSSLQCDCKLRWIATWIRDSDLQVTSRERNPQFCGSPPQLRPRSFYQLAPKGTTTTPPFAYNYSSIPIAFKLPIQVPLSRTKLLLLQHFNHHLLLGMVMDMLSNYYFFFLNDEVFR